jgi:hypothetical protein
MPTPAKPLCCRTFRSRFDESGYGVRLRYVDGVASRNLENRTRSEAQGNIGITYRFKVGFVAHLDRD